MEQLRRVSAPKDGQKHSVWKDHVIEMYSLYLPYGDLLSDAVSVWCDQHIDGRMGIQLGKPRMMIGMSSGV